MFVLVVSKIGSGLSTASRILGSRRVPPVRGRVDFGIIGDVGSVYNL